MLSHMMLSHMCDVRPIDSCITQLKDQGPSRTCNEIKADEEEDADVRFKLQTLWSRGI